MEKIKFFEAKAGKLKSRFFYAVIITMLIVSFTSCQNEDNKSTVTTISGTIYFPDGSVRQGVYVELRQFHRDGSLTRMQTTSTNQNGEYKLIAEAKSGSYGVYAEVRFVDGRYYYATFPFNLTAGQQHIVNFTIFTIQ